MGNASVEERREIADRLRAGSGHGLLGLYSAVLGDDAKNRTSVLYNQLADLIDPGEDVSVSAYDLLPEEDREILWWVHSVDGGLDAVSARYREAYYRRIELCSTLGIDTETGWSDAMAEMTRRLMPPGFEWTDAFADAVDFMDCVHDLLYTIDGGEHTSKEMFADIMKRLMPEGIEWPRFEDGEPVRIGDDFEDLGQVAGIKFGAGGVTIEGTAGNSDLFITSDERVKRPAPAVLAADGEPLEPGQTVWHVDDGRELYVYDIDSKWGVGVSWQNGEIEATGRINPDQLTHQRPVLDAGGVPIREGDTVWFVGGSEPAEVAYAITADASHPDEVVLKGYEDDWPVNADKLTHAKPEPPDTWERIEFDLRKGYIEYWGCSGCSCSDCPSAVDGKRPMDLFDASCSEAMHKDIVRRCKALAEREMGE